MSQLNEGVIKYDRTGFEKTPPLKKFQYEDLERIRERLYRTKLIGVYPNGLGYGNISERKGKEFVITGTQTGHLPKLTGENYTRVVDFSLEKFSLKTVGPVEASSEAMTHATIYHFQKEVEAIFHIHSKIIWEGMLKENALQTSAKIEYGTKEMAYAIKDCLQIHQKNKGAIAMAGHEDGIIIFAPSLETAMKMTTDLYKKFISSSWEAL